MLHFILLLVNCCIAQGILATESFEECGGTLTDSEGVIRSPGFPDNYPNSIDCYWLINVPPGQTITLTTAFFDTEYSRDTLDIRDGDNKNAPQLGYFSGEEKDEPELLSTYNTMWLHFNTDSKTSYSGFELYYTTAMTECHAHYTEKSGVLHSPRWPDHYPNNARCTWTITVGYGEHITFATTKFDTERNDDYLQIWDGKDSNADSLLKWSGEDQEVPEVVSSYNEVYIHFHSDSGTTYDGFEIYWTTNMTSCHADYTKDEGVIHSPGWPGQYPNNAHCFWTITVSPGDRIYLNTTSFDTEGSHDYLKVWDGPNSDSHLLGQWYGPQHDIREIVSSYNELSLYFQTDSSNVYNGFEIFWTTEMSECHHHFTDNEGTIHSPGWPGNYPNNAVCTWTITVTPGDTITFTTDHLDTEGSHDYLEVRDGSDSDATTILKRYGRNQDVPEVRSSHNELYIHFISDSSNSYSGFQSFWTTNMTRCHADYNTNEGTIHSPGWPEIYPNNAKCKWTITVTPGETIKFTTLKFDTEGSHDYLQVFDGSDSTADSLLKRYGQNQDVPEVVSTHNQISVYFYSDGSRNNYKGFESIWTTSMTECHAHFSESKGAFHSPHWPEKYPNNARCSWTITTDPWNTISLNFTHFDTEGSSDYLQIWDGPDSNSPKLTKLYGRDKHFDIITSSHHQLYMYFTTDGSKNYGGFEVHWTTYY